MRREWGSDQNDEKQVEDFSLSHVQLEKVSSRRLCLPFRHSWSLVVFRSQQKSSLRPTACTGRHHCPYLAEYYEGGE